MAAATRTDIQERIEHEARVAGIRKLSRPSMEAVERRRLQLWGVTIIVIVTMALAAAVASLARSSDVEWLKPGVTRVAIISLALGFSAYAIEKEIHLHRLSRLLMDERVLSSALSNRLQQHSELTAAGRAVNSILDMHEVLDVILSNALGMLHVETGSIMLIEGEDEDELVAVAARGSNDIALGARLQLGQSIAGRVARSREPLLLSGRVDDELYPGHQARVPAPHSAMCVPLVNRGQLLGVLNISSFGERTFDEHDLQLLCLLAEQVAAAITNARLYEAERVHVAQLLELDRTKTQFVASVSHELRTPLTSIRGALSASRRAATDEQREELLDVIDRQTQRLSSMVEEMLTAARLERKGTMPMLRRIDLAALVRLVALDSQVAGRPVEVQAPERCEIRADPESMRRIVGNLIENAHKYGKPPVRVVVEPAGDKVLLSVVDKGAGVPQTEREKIFERFYRSERTATSRPGIGLGLPIVRGLVEATGGTVWVEDAPGGGAAFRVALKVRPLDEQEVEPCTASQRS
ncbi:MAG TPA: ATP-binding protein [Acidimicrobiia bacterium]|jgi:two-component system sensor histidine kinase KdpD